MFFTIICFYLKNIFQNFLTDIKKSPVQNCCSVAGEFYTFFCQFRFYYNILF